MSLKRENLKKECKATFVGYAERTNTYRFLLKNQIVISCDAVFLDSESSSSNQEEDNTKNEETIIKIVGTEEVTSEDTNGPQILKNNLTTCELREL